MHVHGCEHVGAAWASAGSVSSCGRLGLCMPDRRRVQRVEGVKGTGGPHKDGEDRKCSRVRASSLAWPRARAPTTSFHAAHCACQLHRMEQRPCDPIVLGKKKKAWRPYQRGSFWAGHRCLSHVLTRGTTSFWPSPTEEPRQHQEIRANESFSELRSAGSSPFLDPCVVVV